jgi:hypothetical protein
MRTATFSIVFFLLGLRAPVGHETDATTSARLS